MPWVRRGGACAECRGHRQRPAVRGHRKTQEKRARCDHDWDRCRCGEALAGPDRITAAGLACLKAADALGEVPAGQVLMQVRDVLKAARHLARTAGIEEDGS